MLKNEGQTHGVEYLATGLPNNNLLLPPPSIKLIGYFLKISVFQKSYTVPSVTPDQIIDAYMLVWHFK